MLGRGPPSRIHEVQTKAADEGPPLLGDLRRMKVPFDLRVPRADLPAPLRPWVHEYYATGLDIPAGETLRIPVSATTDPALNVTYSGSVVIHIGDGFSIPPVTLAGPQPAAYAIEARGQLRGFYVRFDIVGPLALVGVEDYSLTDGADPLHEMVRPDLRVATRIWEQDLLNAGDFSERVELTNQFLLAHRTEPDARVRLLQAAVERIDRADGNLRMNDLARELDIGPSTLRRHFAVLGMSAKRFASVLRFRRAHRYLSTTPDATWADAIGRFGYADQAHFIRDYRRFSGTPPTGWEPGLRAVDRRMGIEGPPFGDG